SNCNNKSCIENEELIPYFLLFLLTAFLRLPESYEIILSSAQITLKERVYNIISSSPSRQWKLTDVADHIFMSTSTLKRKLAEEGTSFSDIYLSARMNQAAKLLRIGNHNVNAVALKCGYDSTSYFIQCF
ncbi:helix-turn-helix domain-containing protein, partial [Salmonella enterica subsp. enterica serovar Enteritidis]|nr:helix-turn-helix domain-containing protein [Salmonella enterica subsp. enterica serovar Enteritidis]